MNYCPKCGRQVSPEDNVCGDCGNPLRASQPPKRMPSREAKRDMRPILIVGIVAVLVIALLGCVLIINLGFREPEAAEKAVVTSEVVQAEEMIPKEDTGEETAQDSPTAAPLTEVPYYVTGVSNQIKVRSETDTDSPVVTKLENGDAVKLLDNSDQIYWRVRVEDEQVEGYIDSRYLTDEQLAVISPREMYVSGVPAYLTLASTNGADYSEVGRAYNGDRVTVLSEPEGELWYVYVESLRSYGYVLKDYLGNEKPTPAPTPTPTPQSTAPAAITNYNMYVTDVEYYLALRSEKAYNASNELGKLYNGETVEVVNDTTGDYWYVYAPTLGKYGYVNADYLTSRAPAPTTYHTGDFWTVTDVTYYLALRSQPSYDGANELGKLYNGERVKVIDTPSGDYWYVYAPTLDMYGYVNSDYLR